MVLVALVWSPPDSFQFFLGPTFCGKMSRCGGVLAGFLESWSGAAVSLPNVSCSFPFVLFRSSWRIRFLRLIARRHHRSRESACTRQEAHVGRGTRRILRKPTAGLRCTHSLSGVTAWGGVATSTAYPWLSSALPRRERSWPRPPLSRCIRDSRGTIIRMPAAQLLPRGVSARVDHPAVIVRFLPETITQHQFRVSLVRSHAHTNLLNTKIPVSITAHERHAVTGRLGCEKGRLAPPASSPTKNFPSRKRRAASDCTGWL